MFNIISKQSPKYFKCSNCKVFISMSPLITKPKCSHCNQFLKEISEEEYKQKLLMAKKNKGRKKKKTTAKYEKCVK